MFAVLVHIIVFALVAYVVVVLGAAGISLILFGPLVAVACIAYPFSKEAREKAAREMAAKREARRVEAARYSALPLKARAWETARPAAIYGALVIIALGVCFLSDHLRGVH